MLFIKSNIILKIPKLQVSSHCPSIVRNVLLMQVMHFVDEQILQLINKVYTHLLLFLSAQ